MNDNRILVTGAGGFNGGQQLWEAFVAAKCHKSPSLRWAERSIARATVWVLPASQVGAVLPQLPPMKMPGDPDRPAS
jgi:hypothetical protein